LAPSLPRLCTMRVRRRVEAGEAPVGSRDEPQPDTVIEARPGIRFLPAMVAIAVLWWAQALVIPIVLAALASYVLEPPVKWLESIHVRRVFGVPVVLGVLLIGAADGIYALRGEAVAFTERLPSAAHSIAQLLRARSGDTFRPVARVQQAASELAKAATVTSPKPDGVTSVRVEEPTFALKNWLWQSSFGALETASQAVAIFCILYALLVGGDLYKRKIVRMVGPSLSSRRLTVEILSEIERQIERFLWARASISAIIGVAFWLSFRLLGLDEPEVWGILSALLFTVPLVGPTIVCIGATLAGFVQFGSVGMAAAAGGAALGITIVEAYVLTPILMSRVGEMNAVAIFVSLMFWGWLWGLWGLLLAIPITAAVKAVCERVEGWNAVAEVLKA
jgi:predicted PurR-regulated permease PerM